MKTKYLILLFVFYVSNIFAQTDSLTFKNDIDILSKKVSFLENEIETIHSENIRLLQEVNSIKNTQADLKKNYSQLNSGFNRFKQNSKTEIDSLQQVINSNSANIKITADELGVKIEDNHQFTNQSITDLNKTVNQNTLYWIIAILVVALFVLLVFVLLRKQIFKQKTDLDSNLQNTRKALEEEGVKLDNKLIEVLETQLKIINNNSYAAEKEIDHTLALKVADEIIRIQKNLSRMDKDTRGLNQLTASVKRIQDNFASNGYELVEMIGKTYNEGMKASASYNPDSEEKSGVIIRIIKPQVNYKGEMIQSAQIEVSE